MRSIFCKRPGRAVDNERGLSSGEDRAVRSYVGSNPVSNGRRWVPIVLRPGPCRSRRGIPRNENGLIETHSPRLRSRIGAA
jgi:hypothetical protein